MKNESTYQERLLLTRAFCKLDAAAKAVLDTDESAWDIIDNARIAVVKELFAAIQSPVQLESLIILIRADEFKRTLPPYET